MEVGNGGGGGLGDGEWIMNSVSLRYTSDAVMYLLGSLGCDTYLEIHPTGKFKAIMGLQCFHEMVVGREWRNLVVKGTHTHTHLLSTVS